MRNGAPKYQIVHDELLKRLQGGTYAVGMRLPTEGVLCQTFDVSRVTIRKALDNLVRAGYLTARQGSGYVVATLSPPSTTCMTSFTDQVLTDGQVPGAKLLGITKSEHDLPDEVAKFFDEPMWVVERLRTINDQPRFLTQTHIPTRLIDNLSESDFPEYGQDQSILRILRNRFGLEWGTACEQLDSVIADQYIAERLNIEAGKPILSQACIAFSERSEPVFFDQVYREGPIDFNLAGQQTSF